MNTELFHKYGTHFCNLDSEQLDDIFDFEAIYELQDSKINQRALLILSQILVGNISESMQEVKSMQKKNRRSVFECWLSILKDAEKLRNVGQLIVRDYI